MPEPAAVQKEESSWTHSGVSASTGVGSRADWLILPILLLAAGLYLFKLGGAPVCNPDEGLYAEIPREMVESGDYLIPRCNEARYPDKPPMLAWLTAGLYRIFGVSEFTARFCNAAAGVLGVWVVFLLGRALFDSRTGLLAAFVHATSVGTLVFSRFLLLDQSLTTLIALTLLGVWKMIRAENGRRRLAWSALAGASAGATVLTKGLMGLAFPAGVLAVACAWDRTLRRRVRWSALAVSLAAFAAVVLPWHIAAYARNPETIDVLLFNEQINRFLDTREPHDYESLSVPLFLAISLAWAFPWCFSLPLSAAAAWPSLRRDAAAAVPEPERSAVRFIAAWAGVILCFFCVSQCRLPPYALPALPAISLLIAYGWRSFHEDPSPLPRRKLGQFCAALFAFAVTALLVAGAAAWTSITKFLGSTAIVRIGGAVFGFVALAGWMAVLSLKRGRSMTAFVLLGSAAASLCIGNAIGLMVYQSGRSFDRVVRALPPECLSGDGVIVLEQPQEYETIGGLCYYSKRRVRVLERPGRPASPGHYAASERFFISPDEFRALWNSTTPACFVSDPDSSGPPPTTGLDRLRPLGREQGRSLFSNR